MNVLLEPFSYEYMLNAMWVSAMVGGLCAFLSCYLMLKRLVADWRCVVALYCPGCCGGHICWGFRFLWEPSFPADWLRAACCFLTNAPA